MEEKLSQVSGGIDDLDLMLVRELEVDARQSNADLAAKLRLSPPTVRRRIEKLIDQEAISIVSIPDQRALGFDLMALIGINTRPGKIDEVVDYLWQQKSSRAIISTTGCYDIFISTTFRNPQKLLLFISQVLGGNPDLVSIETMTVLRLAKSSWMYLRGETTGLTEARQRELDPYDLKIIKELEARPRETVTRLSKSLGLNRLSTSRKLQALFDDNILRVVSVANPLAFGFDVQVAILLQVHPGELDALADRMIADRRVQHVVFITGKFQLMINTIFRSSTELSRFIIDELKASTGVLSIETLLYLPKPRRSFELMEQD